MKNFFERAVESSVNFIKKHKTTIIHIGALAGGMAIGVGVEKILTPKEEKPEEKTLVVFVPIINKKEKETEGT